jgi:K-box region
VEQTNCEELSKKVAAASLQLKYAFVCQRKMFLSAMTLIQDTINFILVISYRHVRGEELDKMSITELQQLENKLEEGLSRVLNRKVM